MPLKRGNLTGMGGYPLGGMGGYPVWDGRVSCVEGEGLLCRMGGHPLGGMEGGVSSAWDGRVILGGGLVSCEGDGRVSWVGWEGILWVGAGRGLTFSFNSTKCY